MHADAETERFLDDSIEQSDRLLSQVWKSMVSSVLNVFMTKTSINGSTTTTTTTTTTASSARSNRSAVVVIVSCILHVTYAPVKPNARAPPTARSGRAPMQQKKTAQKRIRIPWDFFF
ncbi:hypothetical protein ACI65C_011342 [Semiaphis heraclei]